MKLKYDKETDILYIRLNDLKITESDEKNGVIIDYSINGEVVAIEVLAASKNEHSPLKLEYEVA
jgi:uncharacterized protein YuzE